MSVTFNTPVRVFKRNNPSNDGTIAPDNTGAALVSREKPVAGDNYTAVEVVVPAGSIVHSITTYLTEGATSPGTESIQMAGFTIASIANDAGINVATFDSARAGLLANVGPEDVTVSYVASAGAVGFISVVWTARNPDGTITNVGEGYTNE